jgi:L-ascorbate metabolism protein UlaG (beta-lactamase superfamily)
MTASLTFVGTATVLLRLGPFQLLTDPNFLHRGQRAHLGYGLTSRRLTDPALRIAQLPELDGVLLSHLHGDHFDRVARAELDPALPVLTTRHAQRRLRGWGFREADGLAYWEHRELIHDDSRLRITSVPAQHGPSLVHRLLPPTMGMVLELTQPGERPLRIYQTGDTLCRPMLGAIRERVGDIDVLVAHLGGTRVAGILVTMDDQDGADLVEMIRPAVVVPVHYDDYTVFRSPLSDFTAQADRRGWAAKLRTVRRGETVNLAQAAHSSGADQ